MINVYIIAAYSKSSDRDCDGQLIKYFDFGVNISTLIEFCNDQPSCNCFRDYENNGDYTAYTGSSTHMRRNTTAWVCYFAFEDFFNC